MTKLTQQEKQTFLSDVRVGVLSIPRDGKAPLSSPVWYQYHSGGNLEFVTYDGTLKSRLVQPGMRVSLCVQDEAPPYAYVTVEGPVVEVRSATQDELFGLGVRYLGEEGAKEYGEGAPEGSVLLVGIAPDVWLGADFSRQS